MNRIFFHNFYAKLYLYPGASKERKIVLCFDFDEKFSVKMDWSYLSNNGIWIMTDSLFTRFLGHNRYVGEMAEWLKA